MTHTKWPMKKPKLPGVIGGLGITFKTMLKPAVTVQYPHEREDPPTRARGVIALKEENCTVCMLCSRSCPDWCIYIEGHKEKRPPRREGGRDRTVSVLDRFDIDYALCMYCGICVEVCPFDALFWSPEYEYSESSIAKLLHDKRKLGEWMESVPTPGAARDRRRGEEVAMPVVVSTMVAQNVAFYILAVAMAAAAIGVVRSQNVVHAALFLVVVLAGAAAQYILVAAEFVAWVQVLIYIGAIVILFLFGIMLTRAPMHSEEGSLDNHQRLAAGVVDPLPLRRDHRACSSTPTARRRSPSRAGSWCSGTRATLRRASSATTWCRSKSCRCCCSPPSSARS